jgi:hypothetical protein
MTEAHRASAFIDDGMKPDASLSPKKASLSKNAVV